MRFFTAEMWAGFDDDGHVARRWHDVWDDARQRYESQLPPLLVRLPSAAAAFYDTTRHALHDGVVTGCELSATAQERGPPTLRLRVTSHGVGREERHAYAYNLAYRRVAALRLEPATTDLFSDGLGYWGYDELTDAGGGLLRHGVLFSSGRTLEVVFASFSWRRRRITESEPSK